MLIKLNTNNEKFEELLKAYTTAKRELESFLYHEGLELKAFKEPPAVTDGSDD